MTVTEEEFRQACEEAAGKVSSHITGSKHTQIRVVTIRRIIAGVKQGFRLPPDFTTP